MPVVRRQLHVRINEIDYVFLSDLASSYDQTVASVVRRMIRSMRMGEGRSDAYIRAGSESKARTQPEERSEHWRKPTP
jgi:phage protein D